MKEVESALRLIAELAIKMLDAEKKITDEEVKELVKEAVKEGEAEIKAKAKEETKNLQEVNIVLAKLGPKDLRG